MRAIFVHLRMLRSLFTFRVEQFRGITDECLNDCMRIETLRIARTNSNTYDDNLDCDKQDNNELHASARCLRKLERSALADRAEEKYRTSCRSCRRTDCSSAAYVILSFTARVRALTSNAALKELKYPMSTIPRQSRVKKRGG